jgi:predicted DNA-binding transcriptional regulator YafY
VESYRFGVPKPFTFTELMSLHMSRDLFKIFKGTVFFKSLTSAFQKVQATLPQPALAYLDRIESTFQMGVRPYKDYRRFRNIISKVNQAVVECRRIEILYLPLKRKIETHREIDPYGVRFFDGTLYIIGFCHLRKKMRTFVVDRIKLLKLMDETFPRPADFDLEKYTRHSFKVASGPLQTVIIRISPSWARYVGEKIWHESQHIRKMADKSLELTFRVAGLDEIKQWVLSLGTEARVIEPADLKEMIKQDLEKMRDQYRDPASESTPGRVIKIKN